MKRIIILSVIIFQFNDCFTQKVLFLGTINITRVFNDSYSVTKSAGYELEVGYYRISKDFELNGNHISSANIELLYVGGEDVIYEIIDGIEYFLVNDDEGIGQNFAFNYSVSGNEGPIGSLGVVSTYIYEWISSGNESAHLKIKWDVDMVAPKVLELDFEMQGNIDALATEAVKLLPGFKYEGIGTDIFSASILVNNKSEIVKNSGQVLDELVVSDQNNFNLKLYPNPNNGSFTIDFSNEISTEAKALVYNSLGTLISEEKIDNNKTLFDLTDQPNGIYFVKISDGENVYHEKIIKQ